MKSKERPSLKLLLVAGARPNFMKVAPLLKQIDLQNTHRKIYAQEIDSRLIHTGQHYDESMSALFFKELAIRPPDINLSVGSCSHAVQTANIMIGFEKICISERPDWVVVVGDVNSTMACAIVCAKMGIRVAHIEAGLRSFDRTMPEEINRLVTDALADFLFTPSEDADQNLIKEGISQNKIKLVGNIMIDSLIEHLPKARSLSIMSDLNLEPGKFVYVTLHRPSNVDSKANLSSIIHNMIKIARLLPVVFPVHPRTHKMLLEYGLLPQADARLQLIEPIGYLGSLCLTEYARLVVTDSGGLQEESTFFRTPCLTLRPSTERPVTITLGSNRLTRIETLLNDVNQTLNEPRRRGQVPPLWDGCTAKRILRYMLDA